MSNLANQMFCSLAGCISVLIDSPMHLCPKKDQCCIALLVNIIRGIREGKEVDSGSLGNQIETWMREKESIEPFQILKRLFEESRPCALDFFRGFLIQSSMRLNCDCEVIVIPPQYTTLGRGPSFQADINHYFLDSQRCRSECLIENTSRAQLLSFCPKDLLVRILRMGREPVNLPHTMLLMVEEKMYIFECGLAFNDGGKYTAYFREGYSIYTYGDFGKRDVLLNETGLIWHMVFYKKCSEALTASALDGAGQSLRVEQHAPANEESNIYGDPEIEAHKQLYPESASTEQIYSDLGHSLAEAEENRAASGDGRSAT